MAHIAIRVLNLYIDSDILYINADVSASPGLPATNFAVQVSPSALAATINAAVKDAAIARVEAEGYTVGVLDKKNIFGGAVGL